MAYGPSQGVVALRARTAVTIATALAIMATGASAGPKATSARRSAPPAPAVVAALPDRPIVVLTEEDPGALAVATSRQLLRRSPAAVVVGEGDPATPNVLAEGARRGIPVFPVPAAGDPAGIRAELTRLGAATVWAAGSGAARWAASTGLAAVPSADRLPVVAPTQPADLLVLSDGAPGQAGAVAVARAAGARAGTVPGGDPRTSPSPGTAGHVVALGASFGPPERLAARLATSSAGRQLPGGGQVLFPGRTMVALYGHPGAPALGVLGEQDVTGAVRRAQDLAAQYAPVAGEPVVPAFELIATVASSAPGPDGDYSAEATVAQLRPWVDAAGAAGMYVVLDLQPGRTDFLTQAGRYAELLAEPHVGLALDPEWRLGPAQVHRTQIGSVGIDEVNAVIGWLAQLTRERALPQKLVMLHQFRTSMIAGRERLDTGNDELAVVVHADGFGTPALKFATWTALHAAAPAGIRWGWKNFIDEDSPTFTPAQTMAVGPTRPVFVSYQ
ncbi:hypothetical protein ACQEVB_25940 [Pseudonocardia sp. CA-107938]|uniref:hypothetical protein n=1 Tax=Pseudonocardia sp. CA-107938 TaxID=3240021 RepID=UPI003D90823F